MGFVSDVLHEDPREVVELARTSFEVGRQAYEYVHDTDLVHRAYDNIRNGAAELSRAAGESVAAIAGHDNPADIEVARVKAEQVEQHRTRSM